MKRWLTGLVGLFVMAACSAANAQDLSGYWQGVEYTKDDIFGPNVHWPTSVTIVQNGNTFGGFYYEFADINRQYFGHLTVTNGYVQNNKGSFDIKNFIAFRTPPGTYICTGSIQFTYYPDEEKMVGTSSYSGCAPSQLELYRIRLKSKAAFCRGEPIQLLVTGKAVRWYADKEKKRLLHEGKDYQPRLDSTTIFYVTQTIHATESPVVPLVIGVSTLKVSQIRTVAATCLTRTGTLTAEAIGSPSLQYSLNGGTFQPAAAFTGLIPDAYRITVKDELECRVESRTRLPDSCSESIHLPTAFSPNGDGINDELTIFFDFPSLTVHELTVFNRWGVPVYHTDTETEVRSGDKVWTGKNRDIPVSAGLYSCSLKVKTSTGSLFTVHRSVQVVN